MTGDYIGRHGHLCRSRNIWNRQKNDSVICSADKSWGGAVSDGRDSLPAYGWKQAASKRRWWCAGSVVLNSLEVLQTAVGPDYCRALERYYGHNRELELYNGTPLNSATGMAAWNNRWDQIRVTFGLRPRLSDRQHHFFYYRKRKSQSRHGFRLV